MSENMIQMYRDLISTLCVDLATLDFVPRGDEEFIRKTAGPLQRLSLSLRKAPHEQIGYVEAFPGFNYPEIESLAASLQGKKPRVGFLTCSLNIGLLTPQGTSLEWPLSPDDDTDILARVVFQLVSDFGIPFWENFSTIEKLLNQLEIGDFRVCRGAEWPWRMAAAYCLLGQRSRAVEFLRERLTQIPVLAKPVVDVALQKISELATR